MIINFFKKKSDNSSDQKKINDNREGIINIMALLLEASSIDGRIDESERLKVNELISKYFQIDKEIINEFYNKALSQQKENTSFHNLTSKIHKN